MRRLPTIACDFDNFDNISDDEAERNRRWLERNAVAAGLRLELKTAGYISFMRWLRDTGRISDE